jgi:hypothetical protein
MRVWWWWWRRCEFVEDMEGTCQELSRGGGGERKKGLGVDVGGSSDLQEKD